MRLKITHNLFGRVSTDQGAHLEPDRSTDENGHGDSARASYSSDQPIQSKEEDQFNRWPFAQRIADTLAGRSDPRSLVIGIYGPWGDGKTSTLRLMRNSLTDYPSLVTVEFNPWLFGSDEQLLRGFFATLAAAIGRVLPTRREQFGKLLERYGSLLSATVPGLGEAAKGLGKALSTLELDELRNRLEALLRETGKRIVVLIDDLDRLDRREIQAIFKLVKLSASFDNTSYVLAFDDLIVAAALGESYGAGGASAGQSFLEKIIQVPLHLPPPDSSALRNLAFAGVAEALRLSDITLSQEQAQAFAGHFVQGLEPALETPRQAKLYANALMFALPLLKDEAHPIDHLLIEGIRVFYPNLYIAIRDNPALFVERQSAGSRDDSLKSHVEACINTALQADKVSDADNVRRTLLQVLFPKLEGVFGSTHFGPEWETRWAREQRVCSREYFKRYFTYGVPSDDVSDQAVASFVEAAGTHDNIEPLWSEFAGRGVIRRVVEKLRRLEEEIPISAILNLVLTISRNAHLLPRERGPLVADYTNMQSGILIANLIKRLTPMGTREQLARDVIKAARPFAFGLECLRWIRLPEEKPESERIVSKNCERDLGRIFAERVSNQASITPTYREFPSDAPRLLWAWREYGPEGEVSKYLGARFEAAGTEVDEFLATFFPIARGGLPLAIAHTSYGAVAQLVNPELIYLRLREHYGPELDDLQFDDSSDFFSARRIAHEFARLYWAAKKDNAGSARTPGGMEPQSRGSTDGC